MSFLEMISPISPYNIVGQLSTPDILYISRTHGQPSSFKELVATGCFARGCLWHSQFYHSSLFAFSRIITLIKAFVNKFIHVWWAGAMANVDPYDRGAWWIATPILCTTTSTARAVDLAKVRALASLDFVRHHDHDLCTLQRWEKMFAWCQGLPSGCRPGTRVGLT